ncbi:MAG TPA: hypothetical protein VHA76_15695, partial [Solirubrobacterales bacterium]|nr:hypothetical protein [Solirubrobacterales bacterium]
MGSTPLRHVLAGCAVVIALVAALIASAGAPSGHADAAVGSRWSAGRPAIGEHRVVLRAHVHRAPGRRATRRRQAETVAPATVVSSAATTTADDDTPSVTSGSGSGSGSGPTPTPTPTPESHQSGTTPPPSEPPPSETGSPAATEPNRSTNCFSSPHLCGYPDPTDTGPEGPLTPSGSIVASTPGATISGKEVTGTI